MSRQHRWLLSVLITVSNILLASGTYGQVTNVTNSTSTPTPGSGHDYINMVNEAVNPANGAVSIRVETPGLRLERSAHLAGFRGGRISGFWLKHHFPIAKRVVLCRSTA